MSSPRGAVSALMFLLSLSVFAQTELLVASRGTGQVLRFDWQTGAYLGVFTDTAAAGVADPGGLFYHSGSFFVSSNAGSQVLEIDEVSGGVIMTYGPGSPLTQPRGVAISLAGDVLIASNATNNILRFDRATGAYLGVFAAGGGLSGPLGILYSPAGTLLVSSRNTNQVLEYDGVTGAFVRVLVTAAAPMNQPFGLALDSSGALLVASFSSNQILRYDISSGAFLGVAAQGCTLVNPTWLAVRDDGHLLVSNSGANFVIEYDAAGACVSSTFAGAGSPLLQPRGVAIQRNCLSTVRNVTLGTSYCTIQAAIEAAGTSDLIALEACTYRGAVNFHGRHITIDGVDAIIAGDVVSNGTIRAMGTMLTIGGAYTHGPGAILEAAPDATLRIGDGEGCDSVLCEDVLVLRAPAGTSGLVQYEFAASAPINMAGHDIHLELTSSGQLRASFDAPIHTAGGHIRLLDDASDGFEIRFRAAVQTDGGDFQAEFPFGSSQVSSIDFDGPVDLDEGVFCAGPPNGIEGELTLAFRANVTAGGFEVFADEDTYALAITLGNDAADLINIHGPIVIGSGSPLTGLGEVRAESVRMDGYDVGLYGVFASGGLTVAGSMDISSVGPDDLAIGGADHNSINGALSINDSYWQSGVTHLSGQTIVGGIVWLFCDFDSPVVYDELVAGSGGYLSANLDGNLTLSGGFMTTDQAWISGDIAILPGATMQFDDLSLLTCDVRNDGELRLTPSSSQLMLTGDLTQGASGRLRMRLTDPSLGQASDSLDVSGAVALDGALILELPSPFLPQIGDRFDLIRGGDVAGVFSQVQGNLIAGDRALEVQYDTRSVSLLTVADCNQNGIRDTFDIATGSSSDCNVNEIPDECEFDSDGDGTIDACDGCPDDPFKTAAGVCGCGVLDADPDSDGLPDCVDNCPFNPNPDQADCDGDGVGDACDAPNAPVITAQPVDATVCVNGPLTLAVSASGTPPILYQWRKDGLDVPGATDSTLTIASATLADAGTYDVSVSDACGTTLSAPATVLVDAPPAIVAPPASVRTCIGASATLTVIASGGGLSFQWRKDGSPIQAPSASSLTIDPVTAGAVGAYDVIVSNLCGSATSSVATLALCSLPTIEVFPADQSLICESEIPAADTALIGAQADCGSVLVTWLGDGRDSGSGCPASPLTVSRTYRVTNQCGEFIQRVQAFLVVDAQAPVIATFPSDQTLSCIAELPPPDAGFVSATDGCNAAVSISHVADTIESVVPLIIAREYRASDGCGNATSRTQRFLVTNAPLSVSQQPASQTITLGGSAAFSVLVQAASPVTYQWRRDGAALVDDFRIRGARSATLQISPVDFGDEGQYDVLVSTVCGSATSYPATLTVRCPGDLDGDHQVGSRDLGILLAWWQTGPGGDLDGDGATGPSDLGILLGAWGQSCP